MASPIKERKTAPLPAPEQPRIVRSTQGWCARRDRAELGCCGGGTEKIPDPDNVEKTFSYDLGDENSAALMTLRHDSGTTLVSEPRTHPGISVAGKTMIEKAMNESESEGNDGVVPLVSLNASSTAFYRSLDFKPLIGSHMELNPSESHLWSQGQDGKWSPRKSR